MNDEEAPVQRELCDRTKAFAVRIVRLVSALPPNRVADVLGRQILRSGTSVGAHCREGYRSRSKAELISKLEVALQELDETTYWFELLKESGAVKPNRLTALEKEADEIIRVLVTAVRTLKRKS